jgi:serine/threonine protein kinase
MSTEVTLSERLSQGSLSLEETLQYGVSLAHALKCSHDCRLRSGNLHPDRILVNGSAVRLLDGTDAGPNPYQAPEQLAGQPADARSDVFVFGAILRDMLTGNKPASGQNGDSSGAANGIGPELSFVLSRCLAEDPAQRWQRAGALVIELKLAAAKLRQAKQACELQEQLTAIRSGIGGLGEKLSSQHVAHNEIAGELRKRLEETRLEVEHHGAKAAATTLTLTEVQQKLAGLEKTVSAQSDTIGCVESAIAQTDEVIEHVVDAINAMRLDAGSESGNGETQPK